MYGYGELWFGSRPASSASIGALQSLRNLKGIEDRLGVDAQDTDEEVDSAIQQVRV